MKKALWIALPCALLGFLAWILLLPAEPETTETTSDIASREAPVPVEASASRSEEVPELAAESRTVAEIPAPISAEGALDYFDRKAVYGTVADNAGKPVAGAKLSLFEGGWDDSGDSVLKPLHEAASGEDGRFKIPELRPFRSFRLFVEAAGFASIVQGGVRTGKDTKITLFPAAFLAGEIRDLQTKQPVPGAKLSYRHQRLRDVETVSGPDGKFNLPMPAREQASVLVSAEGYARQRLPLQLQGGETKQRDFGLRKGGEIAGEVYDVETNQPIAGAEIEWSSLPLARSDANGRFRAQGIELSGNRTIMVHAPGYCSLRMEANAAAAGELRLPLVRGVEIEGIVRDREGKPVAGAKIQASLQEDEEQNPISGKFGQAFSSSIMRGVQGKTAAVGKQKPPHGSSWDHAKATRAQKSDAQGRFHLRGLLPSEQSFSVSATHPDFCSGSKGGIKLLESGLKGFAEITLARGASVEGKVSANGRPAIAQAWMRNESNWLECPTNDHGEFAFEHVLEGSYKIGAYPEGMENWEEEGGETLLVAEGGVHRKDLTIETSPSRPISGRVLSPDGKPVPNAKINAWASGSDGRYASREGKSAADGSFKLEVPEMGSALFQISAWDGTNWASQSKVAAGTDSVEIRFPPQGKLRLTVVDARSGEPVPSFQLYYRDPSGKRNRSVALSTDANGLAETDIALGVYDLTIIGSQQGFRNAQVSGVEVSQRPSDPLRVELLPGVKVTLRILGVDGAAFAEGSSHWVNFMPVGGSGPKFFMGNLGANLDESGQCILTGITPGKFRVHLNPADVLLEAAEVEVPDQDSVTLEVRWKPKPAEKKSD